MSFEEYVKEVLQICREEYNKATAPQEQKDLYELLAHYSLDFVIEKYFSRIDATEKDFIERLKKTSKVKFEAQTENKNVFNFLGTFMQTADFELPRHIQEKSVLRQ